MTAGFASPSSAARPEFAAAPWASGSVGVTIRDGVIPFLLCVLVLGACASVVLAEVRSNEPGQPATGARERRTAGGDSAPDQEQSEDRQDDPPVAASPADMAYGTVDPSASAGSN